MVLWLSLVIHKVQDIYCNMISIINLNRMRIKLASLDFSSKRFDQLETIASEQEILDQYLIIKQKLS